MPQKVAELLKSAMLLSPEERAELADCLEESLDAPNLHGDMAEEEFAAELDRRAAELKADPSSGTPWEEVKKMRVSDFWNPNHDKFDSQV